MPRDFWPTSICPLCKSEDTLQHTDDGTRLTCVACGVVLSWAVSERIVLDGFREWMKANGLGKG
jgi:transcription initiation factor TFIIIB Brf1 subunit/transcription initiation factor TFIIB